MKYLTALFVFLALLLFDVVMLAGFVGAGKLTLLGPTQLPGVKPLLAGRTPGMNAVRLQP